MNEEEDYNDIPETDFQSPYNQYGGSIVLLTNPQNELYQFELTLRNAGIDKDGKIIPYGEPLLNDRGIKSVLGQVQGIVNQVTIMSNFEKEIPSVLAYFSESLVEDLMMNRKAYDVKDYSIGDKVVSMANIYAYACMRRAYMQGEKRFWKGSQQEHTIKHEGISKQGKGLSGIFGWGKRND